jgi:lysozyme family protein
MLKSVLICFLILLASAGPPPTMPPKQLGFQEGRWEKAQVRPERRIALDKVVFNTLKNQDRYKNIQKMRNNGVPWFIVAGLHERESSQNFSRHLHEGSSLRYKTQYIPKGRLPDKDPPYTWEESSEDALYILKKEQNVKWDTLEDSLAAIEKYNGLGYQKYHQSVPSPYLWSFTSIYDRGKYVADGRFDQMAVDGQVGVAAVIKRMIERGTIKSFP